MKLLPLKNASQRLFPYLLLVTDPLEQNEWQVGYFGKDFELLWFEKPDSEWTYSDSVFKFSVGSVLEENAVQKSQVSLQRSGC